MGKRLITLIIYDVLGNEVAILINEEKKAGIYELEFDATNITSGIYFYRLTTGTYTATKKMLMIKSHSQLIIPTYRDDLVGDNFKIVFLKLQDLSEIIKV